MHGNNSTVYKAVSTLDLDLRDPLINNNDKEMRSTGEYIFIHNNSNSEIENNKKNGNEDEDGDESTRRQSVVILGSEAAALDDEANAEDIDDSKSVFSEVATTIADQFDEAWSPMFIFSMRGVENVHIYFWLA